MAAGNGRAEADWEYGRGDRRRWRGEKTSEGKVSGGIAC